MGNIFMSCYELPKKKYDSSIMDEYYSLSQFVDTVLKYPHIFDTTIVNKEKHLNTDSLSEIITIIPQDIYIGIFEKKLNVHIHIDEVYIIRKLIPSDVVYLRQKNMTVFKGDGNTKLYFM